MSTILKAGGWQRAIKPFVRRTSKMNFCDESKTVPNAEYRNVRDNKCTGTL